ncbi:hypothetical protein GR925_27565 [Streptomyces sp. HUCO-GS316]|uniref:hypothetical protein n=1 Tax=Streptomyces sp. HUCO-GS316 TaxID=2692198 RepID=UPI00136E543C|nr:hypothetical protein [Streptomyces sp. HUCO-GS316]MXM67086.1 hypothetical protein [Streptomyces sp. HUCO-GS316]
MTLEPTGNPTVDAVLFWGSVVSLLLGIGTGVWRVGRVLVRLTKGVEQYLTDWYGEPDRPGVPARPGVLVRLQRAEEGLAGIGERLGRLEHEMQPNSGASLRDAVDRVNTALARLLPDEPVRPPSADPPPPDEGS